MPRSENEGSEEDVMRGKDADRRSQQVRLSFPPAHDARASVRVLRFPSPPAEARPRDGLLHRIFESQADARPRSVAVLWDERVTAYCVLEARANRLARHLRSRGIEAGALVAVLLPRSPETYVAVLGILKAGGAYVPLDPGWTPERIERILWDSGAAAMVTTDALARGQAGFRGEVVRIDGDRDTILGQSPMRLSRAEVGLKADDLCYVMYDSGASGRPLGVMVEHRNAAHLARAERWLCSMRPDDRVYQGAPLSLDRSVEEMWLAFSAGAALVPATAEMARSGPDLPQLLARRGVTVLSSVPTFLSLMEGGVPSLRLLILGGGESCPPALVRRWSRPGLRILNTYGPTEATVVSTCGEMRAGRPVTIGTAIPGARVYLLDERLRPVARSQAGEICIAGSGVARGYLGNPELSRRRFLRDPFAPREDRPARLFRTGEYAKLDWEGNFQRVEKGGCLPGLPGFTGQIEGAILENRDIRAAACGTREDAAGTPQLAAYVVMRQGAKLDESAVLDHLARRLPPALVPHAIEAVPGLPLLPGGRLDRAALTRSRPMAYPLSRSDTLRRVLAVWEDLFSEVEIEPEAHFFLDLGGDSLLAARLAAELRKLPQLTQVSTLDLYRHPTPVGLARALEVKSVETSSRGQLVGSRPSGWRRLLAGALRALGWELPGSTRKGPVKSSSLNDRESAESRPGQEEEAYDERGQGSVA